MKLYFVIKHFLNSALIFLCLAFRLITILVLWNKFIFWWASSHKLCQLWWAFISSHKLCQLSFKNYAIFSKAGSFIPELFTCGKLCSINISKPFCLLWLVVVDVQVLTSKYWSICCQKMFKHCWFPTLLLFFLWALGGSLSQMYHETSVFFIHLNAKTLCWNLATG